MTTSKVNILELAKQGDPKAVAALINRQLNAKGISCKVSRKDNLLQILLEASDTPDEQVLCAFLEKGMKKLNLQSIETVKLYGKAQSKDIPAASP
jgi:hypothetical protein